MAKDRSMRANSPHLWRDKTGGPRQNVITLRLNDDLVDRLDQLRPLFEGNANLSATGKTSRSEIVRRLLLEGLANYEGDEA